MIHPHLLCSTRRLLSRTTRKKFNSSQYYANSINERFSFSTIQRRQNENLQTIQYWVMALSISVASFQYTTFNYINCEERMKEEPDLEVEEEDDDKDCPFCRYFLDSPCKKQFQAWQECIDVSETYLPTCINNLLQWSWIHVK